uniref:Uncharacterized protein n=1 Tax=Noctiluca scintillans TaxID=2966 RepID=A0A7S1A1W9_NOCSC|mmetsp:Transcript_27222/g.71689  ORF Transcript_27222/g.71689 Transcript_27222/m.71689 type:complete len:214 (+) Transcript_27222:62-703(+)
MPIKATEITDKLNGEWQVQLFETCFKAPIPFCFGCLCPCCMVCLQRKEILEIVGEPYVCCGGMFPCGPLGSPQNENCLYLEGCCCTGCAISANRYIIQTRFNKRNTACDDCILWAVCIANLLVCIGQFVCEDMPEGLEECVDCATMIVDGCMLAQHDVELKHIKSNGYQGPASNLVAALPPLQQQMISQGKPGGMVAGAAVIGAGGAGMAGYK